MLKADRGQIMSNLNDDDRKQFRQFINDYREKRKASSGACPGDVGRGRR